MKIGVVSDTHDRLPTFARAMSLFRRLGVGAVFHAGDYVAPFAAQLIAPDKLSVPLHCVYGNNDGERVGLKAILPSIVEGPLVVEVAGKTIAMHHFIDWFDPATLALADVVISGHNHQADVQTREGKLLLNPGECCGWVNDRCTCAVLDLETMDAQIIEVHD